MYVLCKWDFSLSLVFFSLYRLGLIKRSLYPLHTYIHKVPLFSFFRPRPKCILREKCIFGLDRFRLSRKVSYFRPEKATKSAKIALSHRATYVVPLPSKKHYLPWKILAFKMIQLPKNKKLKNKLRAFVRNHFVDKCSQFIFRFKSFCGSWIILKKAEKNVELRCLALYILYIPYICTYIHAYIKYIKYILLYSILYI